MCNFSYINSKYQYMRGERHIGELFFCDIQSNSIKRVELVDNKEIEYKLFDDNILGRTHNFRVYNDKIITANTDIDSISVLKYLERKIINIGVSRGPKDICVLNNKVYVVCTDSNSLDIVDLDSSKRIITIKVGNYPYSIDKDIENNRVYIASLISGFIDVIDCEDNSIIQTIKGLLYPLKVLVSKNNRYLYVLESNIESNEKGYITFINRKNFKILCRIQVGMIPIDCIEDDNYIYVSNYGDSTISVINIEQKQEVFKIDVRGAPKAISKYHNSIYYSDYDSGNIYELNLEYEVIKKIASGIEPNAIIVI